VAREKDNRQPGDSPMQQPRRKARPRAVDCADRDPFEAREVIDAAPPMMPRMDLVIITDANAPRDRSSSCGSRAAPPDKMRWVGRSSTGSRIRFLWSRCGSAATSGSGDVRAVMIHRSAAIRRLRAGRGTRLRHRQGYGPGRRGVRTSRTETGRRAGGLS